MIRQLFLTHKLQLTSALALQSLMILSGMGLMVSAGYLISETALQPQSILELMLIVTAVRFFGVSRAGLRYAERLVSHDLTFIQLKRCRCFFYRKLEPLIPSQRLHSGDVLNRLVTDVETLQHVYLGLIAPTVTAAAVISLTFLALLFVSAQLAWTLLGFLLLSGLGLPWLTHTLSKANSRAQVKTHAALKQLLTESVQGAHDLNTLGVVPFMQQRASHLHARLAHLQRRQANITGLHNGLSLALTLLAALSAVVIVLPLIERGVLSSSLLAALTFGVMASFEATEPLGRAYQFFGQSQAATQRLSEIIQPPSIRDPKVRCWPPDSLKVRVDAVSFGYGQAESMLDQSQAVLQRVSLELPPNKRLALIGPSGSGKSTLAHLLVRLYDPVKGQITLGSTPLPHYYGHDIRSVFTVISQYSHLFHGTVRHNLHLADPDASDELLWTALAQVELATRIKALPHQLDSPIGEFGYRLSGGERQRLMLARAFLRPAPFLILDEVTAHLDYTTIQKMRHPLNTLMAGRATLMITHHLPLITDFDEIIVLQNGQITEQGTPDALRLAGGWYAQALATSLRKDRL